MRRIISLGLLAAGGAVCSCGTPVMCLASRTSAVTAEEANGIRAHEEIAARVGQKLARAVVPWSGLQRVSGE